MIWRPYNDALISQLREGIFQVWATLRAPAQESILEEEQALAEDTFDMLNRLNTKNVASKAHKLLHSTHLQGM